MPRIEIHTVGDGQIELDLLNILQGGFAVIKQGSPPNILDVIGGIFEAGIRVVDLGIDVAIPTEFDVVHAEEINVNVGVGVSQTTYVTFIPVVDDTYPPFGLPLRFGGGLRRVGLCGFENSGVIMGITDLRIVDCNVETFQDGVWTVHAGLEACIATETAPLQVQITSNSDDIGSNTGDIFDNIADIEIIEGVQDNNYYPPAPVQATEPDETCGSAWYVAEQLEALCQDALSNAQTITLIEWLDIMLVGGGWQTSFLVQAWNFAYANLNANLGTELSAAIPEIAEIMFCNDLNKIATKSEIQSNGVISADAKTFYDAAIDSVTKATWSKWIFVGSLDVTRDCTSFCGAGLWCYEFDFTVNNGSFTLADNGQWTPDFGVYTVAGWQAAYSAGTQNDYANALEIERAFSSSEITQVVMTYDFVLGYYNPTNPQKTFFMLDSVSASPITQNAANPENDGIAKTIIWNGSYMADYIKIRSTPAYWYNAGTGHALGDALVTKLKISGVGANPFGSDNC